MAAGVKPAAKAINTSGIVAVLAQHEAQHTQQHRVVLFFTGHDHAGKNIQRVLAQRAQALQPPLQMCDALAANVAGDFPTLVANCLAQYLENSPIWSRRGRRQRARGELQVHALDKI